MSRGTTIVACALLLVSVSCSGSQGPAPVPAAPDPDTRATLAGPLCENAQCQCVDDPSLVGAAPDGFKRFKVELGPNDGELWATVDNSVLYKSRERATACFYVDLATGDHPISLRAKGKSGFGARLKISETGAAGPWFFDTFEFSCGAPGLCDHQSLRNWKERIARFTAGKHAPCGSVRMLGIDWRTGRMPDNLHPEDFLLEATMKIYKFLPSKPPGTETCTVD